MFLDLDDNKANLVTQALLSYVESFNANEELVNEIIDQIEEQKLSRELSQQFGKKAKVDEQIEQGHNLENHILENCNHI